MLQRWALLRMAYQPGDHNVQRLAVQHLQVKMLFMEYGCPGWYRRRVAYYQRWRLHWLRPTTELGFLHGRGFCISLHGSKSFTLTCLMQCPSWFLVFEDRCSSSFVIMAVPAGTAGGSSKYRWGICLLAIEFILMTVHFWSTIELMQG